MNLFFIYDTTFCKADEDDPKDAILYFFPPQAYDNRYSLCCQLVGATKFLKSTFSSPSIIVLEEGQFVFHWSENYLFVLGASSDVHASVLKRQLLFLNGIFCFYHGSIKHVLKNCKNNRQQFLSTLEIAWSRYITFLQCFDNLLQLPINPLPLSSSRKHINVISKANRLLHMCQLNPSVIAGAVFCNSRILSSQLTPDISFYLTLMSNVNASAPVNNVVDTNSNLPPDIELKYVYLSRKLIGNILKYNHIYVGSHVRMKRTSKACVHVGTAIGSGSEADIDSGNCSESLQECNKENLACKTKAPSPLSVPYGQQNYFACCAFHAGLFRKSLLLAQNQNYFNYLESFFKGSVRWNEDSGIHSQSQLSRKNTPPLVGKEIHSNQVFPVNLTCNHHAYLKAVGFISSGPVKHSNLWSYSDLEFACSLCISHYSQFDKKLALTKKWNSSLFIPHITQVSESVTSNHIFSRSGVQSHKTVKAQKNKKLKLQVLKCRSKNAKTKYNSSIYQLEKPFLKNSSLIVEPVRRTRDFSANLDRFSCHETDETEKMVLFVQRCGACTLLLLLKKKYDDKALTYLWNCGFSMLKELEYGTEKMLENYTQMDASSYLLLYDNTQKILKEHPHYAYTRFSEKLSTEAIQAIQEDFVSDPNLHTMCLLSSHLGVSACHSKQHSAFYLQHDTNMRKVESLLNLNKRAFKKFEKYLNITQ